MELRHLRYFCAVAEELHFGRAAERLHVAQPSLSQQIRQMEKELGVGLLARTTRSVELTAAGRTYFKRARAILDAVQDAGSQARRIADGEEGHLTIGCVGSATYSLLPLLVRTLGESLPHLGITVRGEMLAPAQLEALLAGDIDLALLRPPVQHPRLVAETLRRDRLLLALPSNHRLTTHTELRVAQLRSETFISHAGQGRSVMSNVLNAVCAKAGFVPRIRHEVMETSTLVTMVAAGFGVAIVPAPTADITISGVSFVPLLPKTLGVDLMAASVATNSKPALQTATNILRQATRGPVDRS